MNEARQEFQNYLDKALPGSVMESEYIVFGQIHIQFELGGNLENGTKKRVDRATDRALTLFGEAFPELQHELWVLIYEFQGENIYGADNDYLYQQIPYEEFEWFMTKNVNDIDMKIILGKAKGNDLKVENILRAIANTEMGFEPGIDQRVYFFNPVTDIGFMMYDDRGCCIFSNKADAIRHIYNKRNEWIVDYHRPEIDTYFKLS